MTELNQDQEAIDLNDDPELPQDLRMNFSFRKLLTFIGPGFLMGIAYLDPGNIESDLQTGTIAAYKLLWLLLCSHIVGLLLQRLALRTGVVTGKNMSELAHEFYPPFPRICLWLMLEVSIIASDMQEVIGTALAFYLLSNGKIPLYIGIIITLADTFTFFGLEYFGKRVLEMFFGFLISIMAATFFYEFFVASPDTIEIVKGTFIPWCEGCGTTELMQAVGLVGSIITPYNYYLHSALVKRRQIARSTKEISEANLYYFIEAALVLFCSFFINLFVMSVFAHGLHGKTNYEIRQQCDQRQGIPDPYIFPYNNETVSANIYKGGMFLGCTFGLPALYIWGAGIMAAGQSSTMSGTYAGQSIMEGLLKIEWKPWKRVIVTRSLALLPTLSIVFLTTNGLDNLTGLNDLINCIQTIQLPFALFPMLTFSSNENLMHEFKNSRFSEIYTILICFSIFGMNLFSLFDYIVNTFGNDWYIWVLTSVLSVPYIIFVVYLVLICFSVMQVLPSYVEDLITRKWHLYEVDYGTSVSTNNHMNDDEARQRLVANETEQNFH